jgi:hypothetical protein
MILRSPTEHENADHRHAGMDGRHPAPQDASGHILVNLGPGSPCRDDEPYKGYPTHTKFHDNSPATKPNFEMRTIGTSHFRYFGGAGMTVPQFLHVRSFSSLENF